MSIIELVRVARFCKYGCIYGSSMCHEVVSYCRCLTYSHVLGDLYGRLHCWNTDDVSSLLTLLNAFSVMGTLLAPSFEATLPYNV